MHDYSYDKKRLYKWKWQGTRNYEMIPRNAQKKTLKKWLNQQ